MRFRDSYHQHRKVSSVSMVTECQRYGHTWIFNQSIFGINKRVDKADTDYWCHQIFLLNTCVTPDVSVNLKLLIYKIITTQRLTHSLHRYESFTKKTFSSARFILGSILQIKNILSNAN